MTLLEERDEPDDSGCILGLRETSGEALLEIDRQPTDSDYSVVGPQFRVDDVDAFAVPDDERFKPPGPVARPWGSRYLFLDDPNGIAVVVFSGTSL